MLSTRSGSTHQLPGVYCLANHGVNLILLAYPFSFSGKSAVFNSLIGHLALPTGEGGATRAPICIELKRDGNLSNKSIVLQIERKSQPVSASALRHSLQYRLSKVSSKSQDEIFLKLKTSLGEGEGIQFHGMLRVVQQSLLGSILANMLLVLGCTFFCGGIFLPKKEQVFDKPNVVMSSGLLLMAVMGLLFPVILHFTDTELRFGKSELALSRFSSCVMLITYGAYLFLQLTTQKNSYSPITEEDSPKEDNSDDDDEESPDISKYECVIWISILTLFISILSEYLVNSIEGASVAMNILIAFISVILLPIVGNAAENASAIMFVMKDKLDISLGVAIGSSTQISMFVIPFCVVVGWIMGRPLDLNFQLFETTTLIMTVLVVAFMLQDGTSNYFKGVMLVFCYLIVAASFFVYIDPLSILIIIAYYYYLNRDEWIAVLPRALVAGFVKTDKYFLFAFVQSSGTTITFVIVEGSVITVASVGDSRCILERERVPASGGEVGRLNVGGGAQIGPLRCWPRGLCLSISIGDLDVGEFIVPVPYVKRVNVSCIFEGMESIKRIGIGIGIKSEGHAWNIYKQKNLIPRNL
ncbi:unnamed protein product [Lactuca saligna]|uniref:Vacuolar cation/proton exchanger n=1 Tax=Lactuca saligna TaxID=75948 RepID=A0AA35YY05_LACSI|nr:unnamed protein product [Lactuca saligna]